MAIFFALVSFALLASGAFVREGRERVIYIALSVMAVFFAFLAGSIIRSDHVGASLSGMVSIFMR